MDLLLVAWAIFLRDIGFVEKQGAGERTASAKSQGGATLKLDDANYKAILERELDEERSIAETDNKLGGMLEKLESDLNTVRLRLQDALQPQDKAAMPAYEDLVLCRLIDDLELKVARDRQGLERRNKQLLRELDGKLDTLRSLESRLVKQKTQKAQKVQIAAAPTRGYASVQPEQPAPGSVNSEMFDMVQGSVLPVGSVLAATLAVTWLSQQFLRVATAWRRQKWYKAERMRKVQLRRFQRFQDTAGHMLDELARGHITEARKDLDELTSAVGRVASEPTWEEVIRIEAAAFWERWGPQAFQLEAVIPGAQDAPSEESLRAQWVVERWSMSAQSVVKDSVNAGLAAWAQAGEKPEATAAVATPETEGEEAAADAVAAETHLVIRIFGRWPRQTEWANIANLPLAGDWREKALRLLIPAEKDVKDLPVLGPLCESALTAIITKQVRAALSRNVWGGLTTDLWRLDGRVGRPFQIGYEVVEVEAEVPEEMTAIARSLPQSGTPGCVIPVEASLEPEET